jgi:nitrous oxidase accessory protein NosD
MRVHRVPLEYPTIQAAIAWVEPGDKVHLCAGIYREVVHINKSLILEGEGAAYTSVVGPDGQHHTETLLITGPDAVDVQIQDLSLSDERHPGCGGAVGITGCTKAQFERVNLSIPLLVYERASLTAVDLRLEGLGERLHVGDAAKAILRKATVEYSHGAVVRVHGAAELLLENSTIYCYYGSDEVITATCVQLKEAARATIKNTELLWAETGLELLGSSKALVEGCKITRTGQPISVRDSAHLVVTNSRLSENGSGISIRDAARAEITQVAIIDSGTIHSANPNNVVLKDIVYEE